MWADAFEYDLFVCLGIQTRSPGTRKDYREPTSEFSFPFSPCTDPALCALQRLCYATQRGGEKHATVDRLKTIHFAGLGPEGLDSITPTVREMGPDSGKCLCPSPAVNASQQGRRGAALGSLPADPAQLCPCVQGKSPGPRGARLKPNLTASERGEGCGRVWPGDAITNDSKSFLVRLQESLCFPAFCCWIAKDDLKPEPTIYQNETVSQIVRPKGPLDYAAQPSVQGRPAPLCLISALMLLLQPLPSAESSVCSPAPSQPSLSAVSRPGEE